MTGAPSVAHVAERTTLLWATLLMGLEVAGCAASAVVNGAASSAPAELPSYEQLLEQVRAEFGVPAVAAAVVKDSEIVAAAAVGIRRVDQRVAVQLEDKFHIGSVSKPITATVVATVVEGGLLKWETTVVDVFPDLADRIKPSYAAVTLEQLLSHRAGILPWEEDEEIALAPDFTGSAKQQRRAATLWLLSQAPVAQPGTEHVYSNAGYVIAAAMAEEVTGLAWEDLVLQRLAKPLEMASVGFGWPARGHTAQPWGHKATSDGFVPHEPDDDYQLGPLLAPAGDLHMTILDLARFAELHLEGLQGNARLLMPETFRKLHAPIGDYALGWNVRETADHHLGGAGTFLAAIWVSVPRNVAVVVACNADADEKLVSAVINRSLKRFATDSPGETRNE